MSKAAQSEDPASHLQNLKSPHAKNQFNISVNQWRIGAGKQDMLYLDSVDIDEDFEDTDDNPIEHPISFCFPNSPTSMLVKWDPALVVSSLTKQELKNTFDDRGWYVSMVCGGTKPKVTLARFGLQEVFKASQDEERKATGKHLLHSHVYIVHWKVDEVLSEHVKSFCADARSEAVWWRDGKDGLFPFKSDQEG